MTVDIGEIIVALVDLDIELIDIESNDQWTSDAVIIKTGKPVPHSVFENAGFRVIGEGKNNRYALLQNKS